jgi:hypothetical protein
MRNTEAIDLADLQRKCKPRMVLGYLIAGAGLALLWLASAYLSEGATFTAAGTLLATPKLLTLHALLPS